jgi:hypothetical protein
MKEVKHPILPERPKLLLWSLRLLPAIALMGLVAFFLYLREDGTITDPGYFRGQMINHNGELMDASGHVVQRLPSRPPTRVMK